MNVSISDSARLQKSSWRGRVETLYWSVPTTAPGKNDDTIRRLKQDDQNRNNHNISLVIFLTLPILLILSLGVKNPLVASKVADRTTYFFRLIQLNVISGNEREKKLGNARLGCVLHVPHPCLCLAVACLNIVLSRLLLLQIWPRDVMGGGFNFCVDH